MCKDLITPNVSWLILMLVIVVLMKLPTSGQSVAQFELGKRSDLIFVPVSSHLRVHFLKQWSLIIST